MGDLELRAREFAAAAHHGQKRKYTFDPYIVHPAAVAALVRAVPHTEEMLAAAWLHDTVEDCGVSHKTVLDTFGNEVLLLVLWLTDVSVAGDGNRAVRKALDRAHTAKAPAEAQTVKLADLIDNSRSIVVNDPGFARTYLAEKALLLDVMTRGDAGLMAEARRLLDAGRALLYAQDSFREAVAERSATILRRGKPREIEDGGY